MILDLPPHVEQVLIKTADNQGVSVSDLITQWAMTYQNPMIARAMANKNPSVLGDGLAIQRGLRHEWD